MRRLRGTRRIARHLRRAKIAVINGTAKKDLIERPGDSSVQPDIRSIERDENEDRICGPLEQSIRGLTSAKATARFEPASRYNPQRFPLGDIAD